VSLDELVKFVICALDKCCECVFVRVVLLVDPANEATAE